jgi:hypothetical protein
LGTGEVGVREGGEVCIGHPAGGAFGRDEAGTGGWFAGRAVEEEDEDDEADVEPMFHFILRLCICTDTSQR